MYAGCVTIENSAKSLIVLHLTEYAASAVYLVLSINSLTESCLPFYSAYNSYAFSKGY